MAKSIFKGSIPPDDPLFTQGPMSFVPPPRPSKGDIVVDTSRGPRDPEATREQLEGGPDAKDASNRGAADASAGGSYCEALRKHLAKKSLDS